MFLRFRVTQVVDNVWDNYWHAILRCKPW